VGVAEDLEAERLGRERDEDRLAPVALGLFPLELGQHPLAGGLTLRVEREASVSVVDKPHGRSAPEP
jgi:hypothetical protein